MQDNRISAAQRELDQLEQPAPVVDRRPSLFGVNMLLGMQDKHIYAGTVPPDEVRRRRRVAKRARVARRANRSK